MSIIHPDTRFKILKDVMLRNDIADAERRIVWFLLFEYMNKKTGECWPGDRTIAKRLTLNPGTVYRAKQNLRHLGILGWKPDPKKNGASSYWFIYGSDCIHADVQIVNMQTGVSAPTQTGVSASTQTRIHPKFYANFSSPELTAWDHHERRLGKTTFRDKSGGAWFATRWPPGHPNADANQ